MKCVSNDYTNPNTNLKTLTTLIVTLTLTALTLTLTDPHGLILNFVRNLKLENFSVGEKTPCTEICV